MHLKFYHICAYQDKIVKWNIIPAFVVFFLEVGTDENSQAIMSNLFLMEFL